MLNGVTSLEGLLPVLERRHLLQALLCAQPLPSGRLAPVALLKPLLCPQPQLDPVIRNRVAGLLLQVTHYTPGVFFCLPAGCHCAAPCSPPTHVCAGSHVMCTDLCNLHIRSSLAQYLLAVSMPGVAMRIHSQGMYRERFTLLQASNAAGGADVLVSDILPQLLPLFTCTAAQRKLYGCSQPAAPDATPGPATSLLPGDSPGHSMRPRTRQALEVVDPPVSGAPSL